MTELRTPLKRELRDAPTEQELKRVWAGVQRKRVRRQARLAVRSFAQVAAVALVLVLVALFRWRGGASVPQGVPGALLSEHGVPHVLDGAKERAVHLSDGSRIGLTPPTRLEVVDNSGHSFVTVLHAGRALFDVQPGGPRRWTIEAGLVSVEVVGTRFSVERQADSVEVVVEHGVVLVRGERVPDRIQRLTAGERLRVTAAEPPLAVPVPSTSAAALPLEPRKIGPNRSPSNAPASPSVGASFDALLSQADSERRSGQLGAAEATLGSAIDNAPDGTHASLAAFTLGKLLLDGSNRPAEAARAFSRSVAFGPPAAIAEDALARLVEAEARAGHTELARAAAKQYADRYPNGRKLYAVTRWLEQP